MISSDLLNLISILQWCDYFLFLNWQEDVFLDGFQLADVSWEDKHFFSFILDKVLAVNNKRNQLKIQGI